MWDLKRKRRAVVSARSIVLSAVAAMALAAPVVAKAAEPASSASADYCERKLGNYFYCETPRPPAAEQRKSDPNAAVKPPELVELEAFRKDLEEAKEIAVWNPTPANVERYYRLQKIALDKGGLFADVYRRLVWTNPELDYTLKRPVNEVGKSAWSDDRATDRDLVLRQASQRIGLFYVYAGSCPACKVASPLVKSFSDRYGMPVKAISTDGAPNAHFANAVANRGQLEAWGLQKVTPALLFFQQSDVDARTGAIKPPLKIRGASGELQLMPCLNPQGCVTYAGAGVMAIDEIAERLFVLLVKPPGEDF